MNWTESEWNNSRVDEDSEIVRVFRIWYMVWSFIRERIVEMLIA